MQIAEILRSSLLEMELIHKQQMVEQLELEQALALSLMVEEERLEMARSEAKAEESSSSDDKNYYRQDFKDSHISPSKEEVKKTIFFLIDWSINLSYS